MSKNTFKTVADVVANRLCIGCGACQPACPQDAITLVDFADEGIRPVLASASDCSSCDACLAVCPSVETDFRLGIRDEGPFGKKAIERWGPILEIWEGHASDPDIRFKGSSGGALSALAAYCLEVENMHGVLHVGQNPEDPARNSTRLSQSRAEVLAACGSRYSPASVCNGLKLVEAAPSPCAVIGKPSEIAGLRKSQAINPALDEKVGVALSFFCAETPPTRATTTLAEKMGVPEQALADLEYRGNGWPGHFAPVRKGEDEAAAKMTYSESWAFLQSFRPWSTHIWPDGGGELADISCGDPWYEQPDGKNPGSSLLVVRTQRGAEIVKGAMEAGYLELTPAELWKLDQSQDNLRKKKGATWGRLSSMRLLGLATPDFKNTHLFACWRTLSANERLGSTLGTVKRIFKKDLRKPLQLDAASGTVIEPPVK